MSMYGMDEHYYSEFILYVTSLPAVVVYMMLGS